MLSAVVGASPALAKTTKIKKSSRLATPSDFLLGLWPVYLVCHQIMAHSNVNIACSFNIFCNFNILLRYC
jgi:hypothetical protein